MSKNTGGADCSRCDSKASHKQGNQHLCAKHYRFGQMRATAKRHGKVVPSHEQLAGMVAEGMDCADCHRPMNWLSLDGRCTVASLQHYRNGTMAIVCRSCNTRHAFMAGDTYREIPKDHKFCASCETVKPLASFSADNSRSGEMKVKSACKECSHLAISAWRSSNKSAYNAYQRGYRASRADAMLAERAK